MCDGVCAGATDEFQVVDAGLGAELKRIIAVTTDEWLDCEENLQRWEKSEKNGGLTAADRRVLMATWAAAAWNERRWARRAARKRCQVTHQSATRSARRE